jgi:hypothetical protein
LNGNRPDSLIRQGGGGGGGGGVLVVDREKRSERQYKFS